MKVCLMQKLFTACLPSVLPVSIWSVELLNYSSEKTLSEKMALMFYATFFGWIYNTGVYKGLIDPSCWASAVLLWEILSAKIWALQYLCRHKLSGFSSWRIACWPKGNLFSFTIYYSFHVLFPVHAPIWNVTSLHTLTFVPKQRIKSKLLHR